MSQKGVDKMQMQIGLVGT